MPLRKKAQTQVLLPDDMDSLKEVARRVNGARRIVVFAGAGISTDSGIPDFRSKDGLYKQPAPRTGGLRARQVFDANYLRPDTSLAFYQAMLDFHNTARTAKPSPMHKKFKEWESQGKLHRLYSQNIDGLEGEAGLSVVPLGNCDPSADSSWESPPETVVPLHGSLRRLRLRCTLCHESEEWGKDKLTAVLKRSDVPRCSRCRWRPPSLARPQRRSTEGVLRPDIILLNETHPHGDEIGLIMAADEKKWLDLVLVIGTELTVPGVGKSVRAFAYRDDAPEGTNDKNNLGVGPLVVFVNRTPLPASTYKGVADFALWISCEQFLGLLGGEDLALAASGQGEEDQPLQGEEIEEEEEEEEEEKEEEDGGDVDANDADGDGLSDVDAWLDSVNAMRGEIIALKMQVFEMQIDGLRRLAAGYRAMADARLGGGA